MTTDSITLKIFLSAVNFFSINGSDKKKFYDKHIQEKIMIPFVYTDTDDKYSNVGLNDQHFQLANFTFLVSCVFVAYKSVALDIGNDLISDAVDVLNDALNNYIFDDKNIINDIYILNNCGYFYDIENNARQLKDLMQAEEMQFSILDIDNIINIYDFVVTPEAKKILEYF